MSLDAHRVLAAGLLLFGNYALGKNDGSYYNKSGSRRLASKGRGTDAEGWTAEAAEVWEYSAQDR